MTIQTELLIDDIDAVMVVFNFKWTLKQNLEWQKSPRVVMDLKLTLKNSYQFLINLEMIIVN